MEGVLLRWGLVPFFAQGRPGAYSTINARVESIDTAASYRGPWKRAQRCLVPALGFYEWQQLEDGTKQPFYIRLTDQQPFAFAGLWDRSVREDGEAILSCTIITLPANAFMAGIHNVKARMPAILTKMQRQTWLEGDAAAARAVLQPYPDDLMSAAPVSRRVNSPRNNDVDLIEPLRGHPQAAVP